MKPEAAVLSADSLHRGGWPLWTAFTPFENSSRPLPAPTPSALEPTLSVSALEFWPSLETGRALSPPPRRPQLCGHDFLESVCHKKGGWVLTGKAFLGLSDPHCLSAETGILGVDLNLNT